MPHINREKVNNKKGNNHAKDPEQQYLVPRDKRPEAEVDEFLPRKRPAQFVRYSPSFEFLFEAGDEGENAKSYGEPIIPQARNHNRMRRC